MKDLLRTPSSRSAPYRKPRPSPPRTARRPDDDPRHHPDREHGSCRDEAQSLRKPTDSERRSLPGTGGNRAVSHARGHTSLDGPVRSRPSHATSALSTRADVPGPSLRLPVTASSAPPAITTFNAGPPDADSPDSVAAFLSTIELPDKPASAPPLQTSFPLTPPSLRPPPLSTNAAACANGNGYQVCLVYKGYPFSYDLSALPDDPKGTIALLAITKCNPGPYLLVGAHYRRTGRSRAARAVIKSLLDTLDISSDDGEKHTAALVRASPGTSTTALISPDTPCPTPIDRPMSGYKRAAMRPAMLLLAACEMDISRENPDDPESATHVSAAHDLFRAVYGTVNDAIVAGAVRPQPKNALGLDFPSDGKPDVNGRAPSGPSPRELQSVARVKRLEKELTASRAAQKRMQERLAASNDRLTRTENKMYALESRTRDVHARLDASRVENRELRQRLAESEERARAVAQCPPSSTESRVWGKLKDLLFDNLGGGVRGE